jgi:hypothetical protein
MISHKGNIMQDKLIAVGVLMTGSVGVAGWLEYASDAATLVSIVVVGGLTAWYTWERASKLRRERKKEERNGSGGGSSTPGDQLEK